MKLPIGSDIMQQIQFMLKLQKFPPDWYQAEVHGKACKPGYQSLQQHPERCRCCNNIVQKQPFGVCDNSKQLLQLGFGFPLFYHFIKYSIVLLFISIISYNCPALYKSIQHNKALCSSEAIANSQTKHNLFQWKPKVVRNNQYGLKYRLHKQEVDNSVSENSESSFETSKTDQESSGSLVTICKGMLIGLSSIDKQVDNNQILIRLVSFIAHLIGLIYMRDLLYKQHKYLDERTCSLSDYSIEVRDLPETQGIKQKFKNFFKDMAVGVEPNQIIFILLPDLQQHNIMAEVKMDFVHQYKRLYKQPQTEQKIFKLEEILMKMRNCDSKILNLAKQTERKQLQDVLVVNSAILTFQTQQLKIQALELLEAASKQTLINYFAKTDLVASICPQPREIIWKNFNYPFYKRFGKIVLGWTLSLLFLTLITVVFFFLLSYKTQIVLHSLQIQHDQPQQANYHMATAYIIVYLSIFFVIFFNKLVMGPILHHFTHLEQHRTTDNQEYSFAFKYSLGMFFTTALMTMAVQDLRFNNFYKHDFGVIEEETIMFFMNSFFVPFIWFVNPFQLWVLLKRKLNYGRLDLTQQEANTYMCDLKYDMGKRYAQILETMWFTYFYATLIPLGAILAFFGMTLYYWVDKFNLSHRSSVDHEISGKMCLRGMKLLQITLILKPLGQFLFDFQIKNGYNIFTLICLSLSIIYLVVPVQTILEYVHHQNFNLELRTFQEANKSSLVDSYQKQHPLYSLTSIQKQYKFYSSKKKSLSLNKF